MEEGKAIWIAGGWGERWAVKVLERSDRVNYGTNVLFILEANRRGFRGREDGDRGSCVFSSSG